MGLFNLKKKKHPEQISEITDGSETRHGDLPEGVTAPGNLRSFFPGNSDSGITAIYNFLQADFESRGYNDALINPDDSNRADNIQLLQHDLFLLIEKSATYYEGLLKETDFHIGSRGRAGRIDLVEELKTRKELVVDHLEKIKVIKSEAAGGAGASQRITLSYQRGFMRGLSALTQSKVLNKKL